MNTQTPFPAHAMQPSVPTIDSLNKFEYIDLLRGVAILGVIAVHSHQQISGLFQLVASVFNFGQLGVQLFFVASAITLCLSMTERKEKTVANFYIRRFFRIAPLYYFGIALYFFWRVGNGYIGTEKVAIPAGYNALAIFENIFFLHGFHPKNFNLVVPGGWSIATEMWFYAVFPVLFALQSKMTFRKFLQFSAAVLLSSFAAQFILIKIVQPLLLQRGIIQGIQVNDDFGFLYCSLVNQASVFLIGILAFKSLKTATMSNTLLLLGAFLCCISCYLLNTTEIKTGFNGFFYPVLAAVAFGIFAVKLSTFKTFKGKVSAALIKIGQVSFSMYILHFIFVDIITAAYRATLFNIIENPETRLLVLFFSLIAITYFFAQASYALLEKPAINYAKRFMR